MLIFIQDYLENGTQNATKISSEIIESRSTGRSVTAQSWKSQFFPIEMFNFD